MRHHHLGYVLAAALCLGTPATAQNPFEPLVYVNNSAVTRYELDQRMRFMQLLQAPGADAASAERELVSDRLKLQAAADIGVEVSEQGLEAGLAEFAGRANMTTDQFIQALASGGVERQAYRDFVRAGVAWREVIRQRIVPDVSVSDAEIDQALRKQVETPIITRVLLSEIIIPAPDGQEQAAMNRARQIAGSSPSEAQFAAAARQYSAAGSAGAGGRLNWVDLSNLPPTLRPIVTGLRPGQVSQPLTVPGAVVLFMLRDQQGRLRPGASEQVLDYAVLRLASASDAAAVAARVDTCDDLQAHGAGATLRQTASQGAIPVMIATQLASLDPDESTVMNLGGAADLVMLCSRQPALLAAQSGVATTALDPDGVENATQGATAGDEPDPMALPDRAMVQDEIFNRKINAQAEAFLAELRAEAVIRRP